MMQPRSPYRIYRAIKAGKKIYILTQGTEVRYSWGSSLKQAQAKYAGWEVVQLTFKTWVKSWMRSFHQITTASYGQR